MNPCNYNGAYNSIKTASPIFNNYTHKVLCWLEELCIVWRLQSNLNNHSNYPTDDLIHSLQPTMPIKFNSLYETMFQIINLVLIIKEKKHSWELSIIASVSFCSKNRFSSVSSAPHQQLPLCSSSFTRVLATRPNNGAFLYKLQI